ncbi:MAG: hypothetical protein KIS88_01215 [Anaerolineales bacterium]|nr:hypothetical protein [Anaerolineales bacterium]
MTKTIANSLGIASPGYAGLAKTEKFVFARNAASQMQQTKQSPSLAFLQSPLRIECSKLLPAKMFGDHHE